MTLEIISLERGLDGRALPIEVRAGNVFFLDPETGSVPPFAPTFADPFTGFILPGAGASGINIIDNTLENPTVQQYNLGTRFRVPGDAVLQLDLVHNRGTHFIIGRPIGEVYNPVVGGPDRVVNLESSVGTRYDALLATPREALGQRAAAARVLQPGARPQLRERRPDPVRHRADRPERPRARVRPHAERAAPPPGAVGLVPAAAGAAALGHLDDRFGRADGHPDARRLAPRADAVAQRGRARVPDGVRAQRVHHRRSTPRAASTACRCRSCGEDARFSDGFDSLDLRLSRRFAVTKSFSLEAIVECFNVFNVTNILGVSKTNYSGFTNVLARDSSDPADPGFLRSSSFGHAFTTAGGVFGSGGPRAFQLGLRAQF